VTLEHNHDDHADHDQRPAKEDLEILTDGFSGCAAAAEH